MEYRLVTLPDADEDVEELPASIRGAIIRRIGWLALNADQIIHHPLTGLPGDLKGLCKFRIGDYRVLYWKNDAKREIQVFRVRHRSVVYRRL